MPEPPPVMTATKPFTSKRLAAWIDVVAILNIENMRIANVQTNSLVVEFEI